MLKNPKRWDWLVPFLIVGMILPSVMLGCPRTKAPYETNVADGGWMEIPRYAHEIYSGELEDPAKAGINYLSDFRYGVSVGSEFLDAVSERLGNGNYTLLDGTEVDEGTIFYLIAGAVRAGNGEEVKDVRIKDFYRKTWQRNGPWPFMEVSDFDPYEGTVRYKKDKPDRPVVDCDDESPGFFGALRRVGEVFINLWLKKNLFDLVACYAFNHTVGLAGWGILPAWCVNGPLKKGDDQKAGDVLGFQGALEFPIDPGVIQYQYGATIDIYKKGKPVESKHVTGIIAMDSDGDGIPDKWEIEHGTNPDDPNDPGNPTTDTYVPCPPAGVYWTLAQVDTALQAAGLSRLGNPIYENSDTVPENKFLHYDKPCGATVPKGTALKVYLSAGPLKVLIPCPPAPPSYWDVEQSENALNDVGLKLGDVNMTFSNTVPKDKLIFFDPPCGTLVEVGSYVDACISKGPQNPQTTTVPNIVGKQLGAAETTLINALLRLGTAAQQYSTRPIGEVLGQSPTPGQVVAVNSAVDVTVSKGPQGPNPLTVTIDSPADNFVGTVGQPINFNSTTTGGTMPYSFKWHFPDNSFKYQEDVTKTFDIPGAGWVYLDVTDGNNVTVQKKVWVQINAVP